MKSRGYKLIPILLALLFAVLPGNSRADSSANVLQVYISEQMMTVITDSELHPDSLKCAVSNQNADITETGRLSDENALTKTTVLVDVSASIPSAMRGNIAAALKKLVEDKAVNEEFKIVAFGETINTLQEFSADRYDLANAIDKITFDGKQSKVFDAIYNTLPRIAPADGKATFYRTIVITDGVDDTVSGITKEELFLKLQNERYPIDVAAVSGKADAAENKELSAIVRMSGGRYHSFDPQTDIAELTQKLGVGGYFFFTAKVPAALLDGTTRQVDIGDGVYSVSIDVKFPVFDVPSEPEPPAELTPEPALDPEPTPTAVPDPEILPTPVYKANSVAAWIRANLVFAVVAAVVLLLLIGLVIFLIARQKKKKAPEHTESGASAEYRGGDYDKNTEFIGDADYSGTQFTIKLSNPNNPSKTWTLPVQGELLIGRAEHCAVRLDDKSISREQCKIVLHGDGLAVMHIGSTNKTLLNGSNITGIFPIRSGDILKFGREVLHIDYIQSLGGAVQNDPVQEGSYDRMTESIFQR